MLLVNRKMCACSKKRWRIATGLVAGDYMNKNNGLSVAGHPGGCHFPNVIRRVAFLCYVTLLRTSGGRAIEQAPIRYSGRVSKARMVFMPDVPTVVECSRRGYTDEVAK
jgi:hypothetical protein